MLAVKPQKDVVSLKNVINDINELKNFINDMVFVKKSF